MLLAQGLARRFQHSADGQVQVTVATPTPAGSMNDSPLPFRMVRQPGFAKLAKEVWHADVIHLAGPCFLPMLFGLLFRKPVVVEHDIYQAACPNGLLIHERSKTVCPGHFMAGHYSECVRCNAGHVGLGKSLKMVVMTFPRRWLCRMVTRNIGPTIHVGRRVSLPRTVTIYHGVAGIAPAPKSADELRGQPFCFAYVGRLVSEKGVPVLLGAARELTARGYDFRLKIIGDGPERSKLQEMTNQYGLRNRTTFAGALQGDRLQEALQGISVAIMPSTWEDVAPLAAIEHMIQGRLLIASDIGGLGELVDGLGLKFPPGDVAGLAGCLQRVLDEPFLARAMGAKARERALQRFREERMVADHFALYRDLLAAA